MLRTTDLVYCMFSLGKLYSESQKQCETNLLTMVLLSVDYAFIECESALREK